MALLALARAALGDAIAVATVNHGLRAAAAEECALVARACADWNIPCTVLEVVVEQGNLQDRARAARYAALGRWAGECGVAAIATAHHADDQAETLLMRLNRGSGLGGLAGIRARTRMAGCPVPVVRPLLACRRHELRAAVEGLGLPFVDDPSNADPRFDRVRMRQALATADWVDPLALAASAAHLAEADNALQAIADEAWERDTLAEAGRVSVPAGPHAEIAARLVLRAIAALGGEATRGEVAAFLEALDRRGNLSGVLIEKQGDRYICTPEPPRRTG